MRKRLLLMTMILTMFTFIVQAQIPILQESFEAENLPFGWTVLDADNDGRNWMHSSIYDDLMGGHTGDGAYVSYSYDDWNGEVIYPDNWLITPAISLTGSNSLTFWRMASFGYPADHYGVYISTSSATDTSAFTLLYEETPEASNQTWTMRTVNLDNFTGNTVYIAFRHFNCSDQLFIAIDDITVTSTTDEPIITVQPMSLHFSNAQVGRPSGAKRLQVSTYNITGAINAMVTEHFEISLDNVDFEQTVSLSDTDTILYVRYYPIIEGEDSTLLTLTNGTAYTEVYLFGNSVDCGYFTLPYVQNFNDIPENTIPECWSQINPFDGYPKTTDDYTSSGDNVLMFKCESDGTQPIYAVLPQMPEDLPNLQIQFNTFREESYSGTLSVGYVTDPTDSSTFVPVWSINAAQIGDNDPHTYIVSFDNVTEEASSTCYITFKYVAANSWYWFVDDIIVEDIPTCSSPTSLSVNQVTSTTATVSWSGNTNSYNLYYKTDVDTEWTVITSVMPDDEGYTIENLVPATTYLWYVEAVCDNGSTVQSQTISSFTTDCAVFSAPLYQDFDESVNPPFCWRAYTGLANDVFTGTALTPSTGNEWEFNSSYVFGLRHAKLNIYGTSCNYWLVTPDIDLSELTNPALTFNLALTSYNTANPISNPTGQPDDKFMVVISTDNGATWNAANATVWSNDSSGDYVFNQISAAGQEVTIPLANYAEQTVTIAFYGESTVSNGDNDLHIDNVAVSNLATCPRPANLTILSVTGNSVTLDWEESGNATAWNIEYGPSGFQHSDENATLVNATFHPFTVNNLSTISYDFYVQSDCDDEQSTWTGPITATPGTYNLGITGSDTLISCSMIIYDNGGVNGNYSSNCNFTLVLYPETESDLMTISGTYDTESEWDILRIYDGAGTDGTLIGEYSGTDTIFALVSSTGPLTIKFTSDGGVQKSGFILNTNCISCTPPDDLTVSNVTTCSADISWNPGGEENNWILEYKEVSDLVWTLVTVSGVTTYSLNGLAAGTTYQVRVQANCGDGNLSVFSMQSFTTDSTILPTVVTEIASSVTEYGAVLNGYISSLGNIGITSRGFEWKPASDSTFSSVIASDGYPLFSHHISNLSPNTDYVFKAFITTDDTILYGQEETFTTLPDTCETPSDLTATEINTDNINITWAVSPNSIGWIIRYRQVNGPWIYASSDINSYHVSGLIPGNTYQIQVQADCGIHYPSEWTSITVTTLTDGISDHLFNSITLFPNPANDVVNVQCTMYNVQLEGIEVIDIYGKVVSTVVGANNYSPLPTRINVSSLADGMYFVRVTTDQGMVTKPFIVKR